MVTDRSPELPENFTYEQGRDTRMNPEYVHPGDECQIRFRNLATGDLFESTVTVREALKRDADCDRLYVNIHCNTFDREVEFQFDKETGCIIQHCQDEIQEIGYIVSLREPTKEPRIPDAAAEIAKLQAERPPAEFMGPFPPRFK
ncbi:MAG: hypothetical protein Q8Q11_01410 [bacterium]|nr:hypothetical protein [bacterium]MDZ4247936.1 hypothetical protein [Patescibacteria group bacterium]